MCLAVYACLYQHQHPGVKGNDQADRLAGKAKIRSEVLRSLRHYLRAQGEGHYTIDRLEEVSKDKALDDLG